MSEDVQPAAVVGTIIVLIVLIVVLGLDRCASRNAEVFRHCLDSGRTPAECDNTTTRPR